MRVELSTGTIYEFTPDDHVEAVEALSSNEDATVCVSTATGDLYLRPSEVIAIDERTS